MLVTKRPRPPPNFVTRGVLVRGGHLSGPRAAHPDAEADPEARRLLQGGVPARRGPQHRRPVHRRAALARVAVRQPVQLAPGLLLLTLHRYDSHRWPLGVFFVLLRLFQIVSLEKGGLQQASDASRARRSLTMYCSSRHACECSLYQQSIPYKWHTLTSLRLRVCEACNRH
eukprot:1178896-Prorocentrum_minimum.AAC.6